MDISKQAKQGLLFGDPKDQLLIDILSFERGIRVEALDREDIEAMTGLQRPTLDNWRKGRNMKPETVEAAIEKARLYLATAAEYRQRKGTYDAKEHDRLSRALARFAAAFANPEASIYDVAEILGMEMKVCQQALDSIIYRSWPLLSSFYYDMPAPGVRESDDLGEQHLKRYEGVYLVHIRRGEQLWLQAPMRVRYLQECGKGRFLRCKMNFPIIDPASLPPSRDGSPPPKYWEFDGTVAVRDNNLFFVFEKRQSDRQDIFIFITRTESTTGSKHLTLSGKYLTTGQDTRQSIVSDDLMLHRLFSDNGKDPLHLGYRDIMWNEVKVLTSKPDINVADQRWQQYRTRYEHDDDPKQ